jgi:hypothetical protein
VKGRGLFRTKELLRPDKRSHRAERAIWPKSAWLQINPQEGKSMNPYQDLDQTGFLRHTDLSAEPASASNLPLLP